MLEVCRFFILFMWDGKIKSFGIWRGLEEWYNLLYVYNWFWVVCENGLCEDGRGGGVRKVVM